MSLAHRGMAWQSQIDAAHYLYERAARASCVQNPAPMKPLGKAVRGVFRAVYIAAGPPDYTVQASGVSFLLEAKSIDSDDAFPLARLELHQADRMDRHTAQLGHAFVLLRLKGAPWLLPWAQLGPLWRAWHAVQLAGGRAKAGTASLDDTALAKVGVRLRSADWLDAAIAVARRTA